MSWDGRPGYSGGASQTVPVDSQQNYGNNSPDYNNRSLRNKPVKYPPSMIGGGYHNPQDSYNR